MLLNFKFKNNFYYYLYNNFCNYIYIFFQNINNKRFSNINTYRLGIWFNLFVKKWKNSFMKKYFEKYSSKLKNLAICNFYLPALLPSKNYLTHFNSMLNIMSIFFKVENKSKNFDRIYLKPNNLICFYYYKNILTAYRLNLCFEKLKKKNKLKFLFLMDFYIIYYKFFVYFI